MQIKILYDNFSLNRKFKSGWGFSCLVDEKILFDTGEDATALLKNMETMKADISQFEAVVISHDHWDHQGGLGGVLERNSKLKVYACPGFSRDFKDRVKSYGSRLIELDKFSLIADNVYSTGEIKGIYAGGNMPEQSLVLKTSPGITIITGCAHPGIIKIIENVKENLPGNIHLVMGGFHLLKEDKKSIISIVNKFRQSGVARVAPSHCSGADAAAEFRKEYKENFIELKAGQAINI